MKNGHVVYVHCNCGIGRAVAAAAGYFVAVENWVPEITALYMTYLRPVSYVDMDALCTIPNDFAKKFG